MSQNQSLCLQLLTGLEQRELTGIASLTAADDSGQFGLLPGHQPLVTWVQPGLLSYRHAEQAEQKQYLASSGGSLVSDGRTIKLVASRILGPSPEPQQLLAQLDQQLAAEQAERQGARSARADLEQSLIKRLNRLAEG